MHTTHAQLTGAEGLPIHLATDHPDASPRAAAVVIHGFTGHNNRNIIPAISRHLASLGLAVHRPTLSHAGVKPGEDRITDLDTFAQDSLAHCLFDIRTVIDAIATGELAGKGLPLVLCGHSRGGAQAIGAAGLAAAEGWAIAPSAVVSLAATAEFTRFTDDMKRTLEQQGYIERAASRAEGGVVRLSRTWFEHHLDNPGRSVFREALEEVRCPVLVAHGTEDDSVQPAHAHTIMDLLADNPSADATLALIEGTEHNFHVHGLGEEAANDDNPYARRLYDAVSAFIDRVLPAPS